MENEYGFLNYFNDIGNIGSKLYSTFANLSNTDISTKISETKDRASSSISDLFKDSKTKQLEEFQKAKEEYKPSEEQQILGEQEDYRAAKPTDIKTGSDYITGQKQEQTLDKKLSDIEKVINKFSDSKPVTGGGGGSSGRDFAFDSRLDKNLNVGSLDLSGEYTNDILSSIRRKPAVNEDRVSLLLQDLKKYNLL
jgi:hypothetical protein